MAGCHPGGKGEMGDDEGLKVESCCCKGVDGEEGCGCWLKFTLVCGRFAASPRETVVVSSLIPSSVFFVHSVVKSFLPARPQRLSRAKTLGNGGIYPFFSNIPSLPTPTTTTTRTTSPITTNQAIGKTHPSAFNLINTFS